MPDDFETWTLPTTHLGQSIRVYDRLDSTNTLALALADDPQNHGHVLLAREQSAGRGQYGRTWHAPRESSVLLSVLLFPPPILRRPVVLTAWAAVSVCATIRELAGLDATIKWPNDVLIAGKKVCGILIEQRTTGHADFPLASVAGIGLNIRQTPEDFAAADLPDAISIAAAARRMFAHVDVAKQLVRQLDKQFHQLLDGDFATLETHWKERLDLLGRIIAVETTHGIQHGTLLDVAFSGIVLRSDVGEIVCLPPESVRHLSTKY